MKAQHLPSYYQHKLRLLKATAKNLWKLQFFLLLLFMVACNNAPKEDGSKPPSPFSPPKSWEANPKGGYKVNMVTGQPVEPITTKDGKIIPTGIPIPAIGKKINPDSIAKPKLLTFIPTQSENKTMDKIYPVPENLQKIPVDESQLIKHNAANSQQGYVLKSPLGDTILTGKPITAKGKTAKLFAPTIKPALPLRINENALYDIQNLTMDEGLPNPFVGNMLEDKNGYFWFCSLGSGLSRYDGKSFVTYTTANGLPESDIRSILQDKKGNFWIGTLSNGMCKFDGKTFVKFSTANGLAGNFVRKIIEDKSGNIWFATDGGVSKLDPSKNDNSCTIINYTTNEGLSNNKVETVLLDKVGNLWLGTEGGGINKFDGSTFTHFTTKEGLVNDTVSCMMEDKERNLWFGTRRGISKFDGKTFVNFPLQFLADNGRSKNNISSIIEDKSGYIWIGTAGSGVVKYDGKNFIHITEDEGLSNNNVMGNSIMEDRSGHLWFGTTGNGLNRLSPKSFQRFSKKEGLSGNFIWSVLQDRNNNLWFGAGGKLNLFNGKTFIHFPFGTVTSSIQDKSGNLWFGTVGKGVGKYDGKNFYQIDDFKRFGSSDVRSVFQDSRGHLWFGTNRAGIVRYEQAADGQTGTFFHFAETEGFISRSTYAILEDKSGNIWFGNGLGVTKYTPTKDGQSGTFVHFTAAEGLGLLVNSIAEDKKGNLWFTASDGGLTRFVPSKQGHSGTFTHFTTTQGLASNNVRAIFIDKSDKFWISTRNGLSKFDGKTFSNFTTNEGLSSNQLNPIVNDKNGNLWIPTQSGLSKMDKNVYKRSQQAPVVSLRQLYIKEAIPNYRNPSDSTVQKIKFDGVQVFENFPINPRIPFDQNHLSFQFSAIEWAAPTKIKYSFRLLGLDKKWSIPLARTIADYRNLPNGKFIFQLSAIGESGEWSKPFEYSFTILPPWWKTWWAYTIYALLFLGALRIFSKWRERRLEYEKEQLQHKVEERTIELRKKSEELTHSLEDLKSTQSQLIQSEKMASLGELTAGIAHEIQNPLNFVNNFSEVSNELIQEIEEERTKSKEERDEELVGEILTDIKQNLEKINHHGKRADAIVKGMLQHSRSSSATKEPTDINKLADEYLRLAYHGLRAKDKSFNATMKTDFDETIGNLNIIPQDIGRVILNLITNAFYATNEKQKSGIQNYEPTVTVCTKKDKDKVEIKVADNGNGIPKEVLDKIFQPFFTTKPTGQGTGLGLSLSYDIVKAHGGELKVVTKEGKGSDFIIQLPI